MKKLLIILCLAMAGYSASAQIYMAKTCVVSFFSAAPMENIEAVNKAAKPILNTSTNEIAVRVTITGFKFESPLMEEHFNENYMESEKYPHATFKGKIQENIDYTKDGEHKVTVKGALDMHGVSKDRTIDGVLSIKGGVITITTKFNVHVADHKIEVPSMYVKNIAEDVEVKLNTTLEPFAKK